MSPDLQLLSALQALRRRWRQRILLESLGWIALAVLVAIVGAWVLVRFMSDPPTSILVSRIVGYGLIAVAVIRSLAIPLLRRASDERFALYVEEHLPDLHQTFVSAVQELGAPDESRTSPALAARLYSKAVQALRPHLHGAGIERARIVRASQALGAVSAALILFLVFGPDGARSSARMLFIPGATAEAAEIVRALAVSPGNAEVPRGGALDIEAELRNFFADAADLVFRSDSSDEWIRIPMSRAADSTVFTVRLFDLTRNTEYYVESSDVRSGIFRLTVTNLPAVQSVELDLHFPAYSGLPPEHISAGGDVAAIKGTRVTVTGEVTMPVKGGTLVFDDGTRVPLTVDSSGSVRGTFSVTGNGFYRIDLAAPDGRTVTGGIQYIIEALEDHAPLVKITDPGRDTKVSNVDEVTIAAEASDDIGITQLELRYRVNGGDEQVVVLDGSRGARETSAAHTLFLEELPLSAGDLITYHAVAKDGAGNTGSSDVYFIEIRPFARNYREAEQQGGGAGAGASAEQSDSPEGFPARQREIIAGTFNWQRDSARNSANRRREDISVLTISQGKLREDVDNLIRRLTERGIATTDSVFAVIQEELRQASTEMKEAEESLGRGAGSAALEPEQRALQRLQRAEAMYRDVQVQRGQQQQGGGGGGQQQQQNAEDLADLFELQTDKMQNQYETVQQQSQQQSQQQQSVDETLQRLRELASRQQQENERAQRMADAMRERMGQQQAGGGGGASQRELARQAEEEARRLEKLAREQNSQELMDAAQRLQQAADAMRRAAGGTTAQGQSALEELNRAQRQLENARSQQVNEGVRQLAERAEQLSERQRQVAEDVRRMQDAPPQQRGERARELARQKDDLAQGVRELERAADQIARDGRREQPKAANQAGEAANAIRDNRIADKIEFSKRSMTQSAEYANAWEQQIADNLRDVSDRLQNAAGSLESESAARQQERTLEQTRQLVRSVESLRDRMQAQRAQAQSQQQGQQQGQQQAQGQQQGQQQAQGQQQGQQQAQGQQQGQQQAQGQQQGQQRAQGQQGQPGRQGGGRGGQNADDRDSGGAVRYGQITDGNMSGGAAMSGDPRQYSREYSLRRQEAERLRGELVRQGLDTRELDRAIETLRQLEGTRTLMGDPKGLEELQSQLVEGLKSFEFDLYRKLGLADNSKAASGSRPPAPAEYRALVEEYYKALAGEKKRK